MTADAHDIIDLLRDALDLAWGDWVTDTGCVPDSMTIHGPRSTRVSADFRSGNYPAHVGEILIHRLFAVAGAPSGEARIVLHRTADGTVTVEGQLMGEIDAEAADVDPKVCHWHQVVVPAGEATDE